MRNGVLALLIAALAVVVAAGGGGLLPELPGGFGGGGGGVGVAHAQTGGDYDDDNDGLIEVRNLAQLDAIRYDLNGDGMRGSVSASDWARYTAAFPNAVSGMGCPQAGGCTGYELRNSLDFDTNGNGQADSGDAYWNGGQGWASMGGFTFANFNAMNSTGTYTATFDGNKDDGYSISNLYINRLCRRFRCPRSPIQLDQPVHQSRRKQRHPARCAHSEPEYHRQALRHVGKEACCRGRSLVGVPWHRRHGYRHRG